MALAPRETRLPWPIVLAAIGAGAAGAEAGGDEPLLPADASGAEVYEAACAACHGPDGTGKPPSVVGFSTPLPDFTDCDFARREPDADWYAITHAGGPARGFARMMPAFGDALTNPQIRAAIRHTRTFCDDASWPRGELNLPRALVTTKAYPEDELVLEAGVTTESPVTISSQLVYEQRVGARTQIEAILPIEFGEPIPPDDPMEDAPDEWRVGAGDVGLAVKHALLHSLRTGSILSLGGDVFFPTGDEADGFGGETFTFEPYAAYGQIISPAGFLQLQSGAELPLDDGAATGEVFGRLTYGRSFTQGRFGRTWTPMVEVLGAHPLDGDGDDDTTWDLLPELQVTINARQHVRAAIGVRIPLNERDGRSAQVLTYLLWDWFDGGLLEGW